LTTHGYHFRIGSETVLVQGRHVSAALTRRIQTAMQRETSEQAAAAFEALLPRIVILQKVTPRTALAAQSIAPPGSNVVMADWDLHAIPRLAAANKPLRDSRPVYLRNIPQVDGAPDYRNATLSWPKAIAIDAAGVRALASAMRRSHTAPNCDCAILLHRSGDTYAIWKIDEKTLAVTKL
jgi:hypothetical protein